MRLKPVKYQDLTALMKAKPRVAYEALEMHKLLSDNKRDWPFSHCWEEDHEPLTEYYVIFSDPKNPQHFVEIMLTTDLELGLVNASWVSGERR